MVVAKFLCHATVHTNFLEKKTLKEKKYFPTLENVMSIM